jgi:hypothetical protein
MKGATHAIAFMPAKSQVGAAVRAVAIDQAPTTLIVFEQHQVLTHQANGLHGAVTHAWRQQGVKLIQQSHRLPILPQQGATRCAWPNPGQQLVLLCFHEEFL